MTIRKEIIKGAAAAMILAFASWGSNNLGIADSLTMRLFGFGSYEFGEIVKGQYSKSPSEGKLDHYWMQKGLLQIGVEAKNEKGLAIKLAGEGMLHFPFALPSDGSTSGYVYYTPRTTWYIHHAEASYSLGNQVAPYLKIGAGMFPFKYNRDSRNFGEYLFRMTMYPQYMPTDFDTPYKRLLGLNIGSTLFGSLQQRLLLTSEVYMWPLRDFSLTYLADYNLLGFAEIGAGVMGYRMFPVDNSLNRPAAGASNPNNFVFSGTKLMFKLALDFKRILPQSDLWGANDWRLYSEACLNGLDDYPISDTTNQRYPGYNDLKKRTPILIGFNVPTCKILDVLSVECEWWDLYPFANSYAGVYLEGYAQSPNPVRYDGSEHKDEYGGPWHWSVYAKKTIFNHVKLIGQVARDHTVIETSQTGPSVGDPQEAMDGKGNWAWMAKIEFGF